MRNAKNRPFQIHALFYQLVKSELFKESETRHFFLLNFSILAYDFFNILLECTHISHILRLFKSHFIQNQFFLESFQTQCCEVHGFDSCVRVKVISKVGLAAPKFWTNKFIICILGGRRNVSIFCIFLDINKK